MSPFLYDGLQVWALCPPFSFPRNSHSRLAQFQKLNDHKSPAPNRYLGQSSLMMFPKAAILLPLTFSGITGVIATLYNETDKYIHHNANDHSHHNFTEPFHGAHHRHHNRTEPFNVTDVMQYNNTEPYNVTEIYEIYGINVSEVVDIHDAIGQYDNDFDLSVYLGMDNHSINSTDLESRDQKPGTLGFYTCEHALWQGPCWWQPAVGQCVNRAKTPYTWSLGPDKGINCATYPDLYCSENGKFLMGLLHPGWNHQDGKWQSIKCSWIEVFGGCEARDYYKHC